MHIAESRADIVKFIHDIYEIYQDRSNNDAYNLVEDVSVAGLNNNLVYYTDGVRETFQLKPYISPKAEELVQFINKCKEKQR